MIIIALLGMLVSNSKRCLFRGEPMKHKRMMDACARGQWRRSRGSSASRKYTERQRPSRRSSRSCLRRAAGGSPATRIGYAYLNNSERAKPAFLDSMSCFTLKSIRTKKNAYYPFPKTGANSRLQIQDLKQKAQISQLTVSPDYAAIKQVQLSYQNIADQVRDT